MKIQMEMNEKQARIIELGLDVLARLGMGQFDALDKLPFLEEKSDWDQKEEVYGKLKEHFFPELPRNGNYGIANEKTPEECKVAYDMLQVLRSCIVRESDVALSTITQRGNEELVKVQIVSE